MMLMALLRWAGGHVSLISTAPDAHSPPMPMPSRARHISSCITRLRRRRAERGEREDENRRHQRAGAAEAIRDLRRR